MKIFLMKTNVNACTLENSSHMFSSVPWKLSPGKFQHGKFPPVKLPPGEFPPGIFPPKFPSFFFYFFRYCHRYHWYYLKDCFVNLCFKSAEVFTLVKICQNEVLSEERQLMKWVGKFQVRIFWVAILLGEFSRGEFDGWEFFGWEFPRGNFPKTIFFI